MYCCSRSKGTLLLLFEFEETRSGMHAFDETDVVVLDGQGSREFIRNLIGEAEVRYIIAKGC